MVRDKFILILLFLINRKKKNSDQRTKWRKEGGETERERERAKKKDKCSWGTGNDYVAKPKKNKGLNCNNTTICHKINILLLHLDFWLKEMPNSSL